MNLRKKKRGSRGRARGELDVEEEGVGTPPSSPPGRFLASVYSIYSHSVANKKESERLSRILYEHYNSICRTGKNKQTIVHIKIPNSMGKLQSQQLQ